MIAVLPTTTSNNDPEIRYREWLIINQLFSIIIINNYHFLLIIETPFQTPFLMIIVYDGIYWSESSDKFFRTLNNSYQVPQ